MPTYEYACRSCGEHLEAVQAFSDEALTTCPRCGGELRKVFGSVGIVFKGSGFYKTDSRQSSSSVTPASPSDSGHDHAGHDHAGHDHAGHDHGAHGPATTSPDSSSSTTTTPAATAPAAPAPASAPTP